uniref:Uncharacterized protein n=1 Tax=Cryptomonas curvata TaxID=233186 RepID=A0A7S0MR42_9CRYP|mmetsp:Transcript_49683/g.103647  ORF Transcript_49683/g.103647 Transcript_49683/m.103647 type:complete len:218 (+) Transcript_49683:80-733(+)|eukprot:CAMPEP_0172175336 /NCGR_PEP_ID=MMETSP1050-20130122/14169_1 /TAXON_ID=233186 /ORGANISM="Cryptomonas curvata, Strain CCAP979/52" /LENGTH=217 /DNA_ID=CAMNT_0012847423 /DNA_START=39 /DNA_END=692 /DNA_ORIENTATION=-
MSVLSRRASPEAQRTQTKSPSINPATSMNLHLDDISEQCRSRDVKDCAKPSNPGASNHEIPPSPFLSKTKEHIKLFKQYVSTCQKHGVNCSLDPDSSSEGSEPSEEPPRLIHRRSSALASHRPLMKLDSFLTRPRSSSFTGPLSSDNGRSNDSASRTPSQSSAPSRTESPAMSWRSPSSAQSALPQLGHHLDDEGLVSDVYKSQVANALGAGRAVWL